MLWKDPDVIVVSCVGQVPSFFFPASVESITSTSRTANQGLTVWKKKKRLDASVDSAFFKLMLRFRPCDTAMSKLREERNDVLREEDEGWRKEFYLWHTRRGVCVQDDANSSCGTDLEAERLSGVR